MPTSRSTSSRSLPARRRAALACAATGALLLAACSSSTTTDTSAGTTPPTTAGTTSTTAEPGTTVAAAPAGDPAQVTDLVLDPTHDYGDRYADGILPVGDSRYVTDAPTAGQIFLCRAPGGEAGGAQARGPWFTGDGTEYDLNLKVAVEGEVTWDGTFAMEVTGDQRVISTNDLPHDHTTGEFPVSPDDPAYDYDRNPNEIQEQALSYSLAASPTLAAEPTCMGGESGVMLTGVALFNGFDAGGRDAGAWEVQDGCDGHPQISGEYHYHTLSSCIDDATVDTVIGFALDGFPITGPKVAEGNILTTADLDECHGITSTVELDGEQVTTYHYVMTQDFPYSVSCFRATPTTPPR